MQSATFLILSLILSFSYLLTEKFWSEAYKKIIQRVMLFLVILSFLTYVFYNDIMRSLITWQLKNNSTVVYGELVQHKRLPHKTNLGLSVVKFSVDSVNYYAETARIKIPKGIKLPVKYKISNPNWHRVMVPDSLKEYHCFQANSWEETYYTWPPSKMNWERVEKCSGSGKGPF